LVVGVVVVVVVVEVCGNLLYVWLFCMSVFCWGFHVYCVFSWFFVCIFVIV
jgi:hypothetical protein